MRACVSVWACACTPRDITDIEDDVNLATFPNFRLFANCSVPSRVVSSPNFYVNFQWRGKDLSRCYDKVVLVKRWSYVRARLNSVITIKIARSPKSLLQFSVKRKTIVSIRQWYTRVRSRLKISIYRSKISARLDKRREIKRACVQSRKRWWFDDRMVIRFSVTPAIMDRNAERSVIHKSNLLDKRFFVPANRTKSSVKIFGTNVPVVK